MSRTLALLALLTLALPAGAQQDPVDWRARIAALEAAGDDVGALAAAEQARSIDNGDPWTRYTWVRALARVDPVAARGALPGLQDPARLQQLATEERAELASALAYLCLDLDVDHLAAEHFAEVPEGTPAYASAQAGLAILAVRRGDSRQALVHFAAARVAGPLDAALAELERETRFQSALRQFLTARDLRDANGAARALGTSCARCIRRRCVRGPISPACAATPRHANARCVTCYAWTRRHPARRASSWTLCSSNAARPRRSR